MAGEQGCGSSRERIPLQLPCNFGSVPQLLVSVHTLAGVLLTSYLTSMTFPIFFVSFLYLLCMRVCKCVADNDIAYSLLITHCSDRILTCRIKSLRSPVKVRTGCYRFNYQPGS